jgi:asparagine synthase (glutamine-hydrolysing)
MDLPSTDGVNSYIVSKEVARRDYKVALAGVGGDELFGGYSHFRFLSRLKYLALVPRPLVSLPLRFNKGRHLFSDIPARNNAGAFAHWWRRLWNGPLLCEFGFIAPPIQDDTAPSLRDDFARISWAELTNYMLDVLLRDSDQMSMAVSLEVRVPFLDHELVEFVLTLPEKEKYHPKLMKSLLVESVQDLIPREIYDRKKMGFELPMGDWIRGPLHEFTVNGLQSAADRDVLSRAQALTLHERFKHGQLAWQKLWSLVVLGWYLKKENLSAFETESDKERVHELVHST